MKNIRSKLMALAVAGVMTLTGCGASITGVSLALPETMEKGSTAMATPEYAYSGATPEQAKIDEMVDELGLRYTSSDSDVVMVDEDGKLVAVGAGTAEVALSSEDGEISASGVITVTVTPTGISMPDSIELSLVDNMNASIKATVIPNDATDVTVTYTSADENIVTVDNDGYITAVAAGETDITAEVDGSGLAATCHVTVAPAVESLEMSDSAITLGTGDTYTLTLNVVPGEIDTTSATWASSDESVVTVDAEGNVTAVAEGTATVTATLGKTETACEVTVSDAVYEAPAATGNNSATSSNSGASGAGNSSNASSDAGAATSVGLEYGAVPFSLAAGTQEWWHIDETDSAYWAVLNNINAYRTAAGVAPLSVDSGLSAIAHQRCLDMVVDGYISHNGYQTSEIVAQNYPSAQDVVYGWATSPDHYSAMTSANFTVCGIACEFEESGGAYWCVTFG